MRNPILRFETADGNVDVNMETELPLVATIQASGPVADLSYWSPEMQEDESGLAPVEPTILDLTDDWYGPETVNTYAQAILRALRMTDLGTPKELWICGVAYDLKNEDGTPPESVYILAEYAFDGGPFPELFYYNHGAIEWMTLGAETYDVNVVHHNGNTLAFAVSPAYDGEPLAMTYGKVVLEDGGSDALFPELALDEIRERITGGPYYDLARECYLWMDESEHEVKSATIAAQVNGTTREYTLSRVNVLSPQPVPAMAVESGGVIYPGTVTTLIQSLNEDGVSAEGEPLLAALTNMPFPEVRTVWERPLNLLTASDAVSVGSVEVFTDDLKSMLYNDADIGVIDELPAGDYILCFHTNILGPYSVEAGCYTFTNEYTIYKVTLE